MLTREQADNYERESVERSQSVQDRFNEHMRQKRRNRQMLIARYGNNQMTRRYFRNFKG